MILLAPSFTWAQRLCEALQHILLRLFLRTILLVQQNHRLRPPEDVLGASLSAVGLQQR